MCPIQTAIRSLNLYLLGSLVFNSLVLVRAQVNREPCFPTSIGFQDEWPFDLSAGYLPIFADTVKPVFEFYGPGRDKPINLLDYRDLSATSNSIPFYRYAPTKFIIHGFGNALNQSVWITDMRKAFLHNGDYNIVLVGWDTSFPSYVQAVCNSRLVARLTVKVIELLQGKGLDLDDLHLIGHSLGAHISSYVGRLMESKIARITGLDPAGPWFDTFDVGARLDPSDAQFVDVIHTNGHFLSLYGGFGLLKQSGHVDFYPNGGRKQPGCTDGLGGGSETLLERFFTGNTHNIEEPVLAAIGCSHGRAYEIFTESIKPGACRFKSFSCQTFYGFEHGMCSSCGPRGCNYAGLQASPFAQGGKQFFQTNGYSPLCSHSIEVSITPLERANQLAGHLVLYLKGTVGQDAIELESGLIFMSRLTRWTVVKPMKKDIGDIETAAILYNRQTFFNRRKMWVANITMEVLNTGKRYIARSPFQLSTHEQVRIHLEEHSTD